MKCYICGKEIESLQQYQWHLVECHKTSYVDGNVLVEGKLRGVGFVGEGVAVITGTLGLLGPIWKFVCETMGYKVFGIDLPEYDLRYKADIDRAVSDCIKTVGVPRVLIHNAGVDAPPSDKAKSDFWTEGDIFSVNYHAGKYVANRFLPTMIHEPGKVSRVIFIGSLLGSVAADHRNYNEGFDKPVDYGASKAALRQLVKNLATRWARKNILVNMLSFSMVEGKGITEEFKSKYLNNVPLGRPCTEWDCVNAMMGELANSYRTGQEVLVDGGYTSW